MNNDPAKKCIMSRTSNTKPRPSLVAGFLLTATLVWGSLLQAATIVHLSDLHAGGTDTADLVQAIRQSERKKADLTIVTGDIVNCGMLSFKDDDRPDVADYEIARAIVNKNWMVVPGNHEYCWTGYAGFAQFEKQLGPRHGIRDIDGWRFIGLDFGIPYSHAAFISPDELQWLETVLKEAHGAPCVLFFHAPPQCILNQEQLIPLLEKYPVRLILAGHLHTNSISVYHGVPVVLTGALLAGWYSVLKIQGKQVDVTTENALKPELKPIDCAIYDAEGRLDPKGVIKKETEAPAHSKALPSSCVVYKVEDAAIRVPPARMKDCLYFSTSLGHCWELRIPPAGQKFTPELFRSSLRKIGDFKGNLAFIFFDSKGRPCFLSDCGQLILPDETTDLNRVISCPPIIQNDILVIGTVAGTVIFFDLKNRQIKKEIDLNTTTPVAGMAADSDGVYICSFDETLRSLDWDGDSRWKIKVTAINYSASIYPASPLVHSNVVYVVSSPAKAWAFSTHDGTKLWEKDLGNCSSFTPLWMHNGDPALDRVVIGDDKGSLNAIHPISGEKTVLWNSPKHQIVAGAVQGSNVFLNCWNGAMVRWTPEKVRIWEYNVPQQYTMHAPVPLDNEVLLPCWNGTFISFSE